MSFPTMRTSAATTRLECSTSGFPPARNVDAPTLRSSAVRWSKTTPTSTDDAVRLTLSNVPVRLRYATPTEKFGVKRRASEADKTTVL